MCNWTRYLFVCSKTLYFNLVLQEYCILLQLTCKSWHNYYFKCFGKFGYLPKCYPSNAVFWSELFFQTFLPPKSCIIQWYTLYLYTSYVGVFNFWGVWPTYPKWKSVVYAPTGVHKIPYREWVFIKLSTWGIPKFLIFESVCMYWNEVCIWWIPLFMMMILNDLCGLSS